MGYIIYSLVQFVAIDVEKLNLKKHWTVKLGNLGTWGYVVVQSSIIPSLYNVTYWWKFSSACTELDSGNIWLSNTSFRKRVRTATMTTQRMQTTLMVYVYADS